MTRLATTCLAVVMMMTVALCYVIHIEADIDIGATNLQNKHSVRAIDNGFNSPLATVTVTITDPSPTSTTKTLAPLSTSEIGSDTVIPPTKSLKESEPSSTGTAPTQGGFDQVDHAPCLKLYEPCTPSHSHCCTGSCQPYTLFMSIGNFTVCMK